MLDEKRKIYLGDAVYAQIENGVLILTTENGMRTTNAIAIDENVLECLLEYLKEREIY